MDERKIDERKKVTELQNFISLAGGAFITVITVVFVYFKLQGWYGVGATMIATGYLGFGGIVSIPIGFNGVPLLFGRRLKFFTLPEGLSWVLPRPFMGYESVNMKEQTSNPGPTEVLTGKEGKETVRVIADAAIQWKIVNPYKVLDVGINVIQEGMDSLIQQVIRSTLADKTPDEAIQIHEELKDHLETESTKKSDDWGVEIRNVFITQLTFAEEVTKDYERVTREKKQLLAEKIEMKHLREEVEELKKMGLSPEKATEVFQTERGKVTKTIEEKIYKGLGGTGILGAVADNFLSGKSENKRKKKGGQ